MAGLEAATEPQSRRDTAFAFDQASPIPSIRDSTSVSPFLRQHQIGTHDIVRGVLDYSSLPPSPPWSRACRLVVHDQNMNRCARSNDFTHHCGHFKDSLATSR
jgi:hypothetical protein